MRVSAIRGDRGFLEPPIPVDIYLNGIKQKSVVWADEEAGALERYVLDEGGDPQIDPDIPNKFWTVTMVGDVRLDWQIDPRIVRPISAWRSIRLWWCGIMFRIEIRRRIRVVKKVAIGVDEIRRRLHSI